MGYKKIITYTLQSESGSSLKALRAVKVSQIKGGGWDRPKRKRKDQDVYYQPKTRWEIPLIQ